MLFLLIQLLSYRHSFQLSSIIKPFCFRAEENGIEFGSADRTKTTVYGEDFTRTAPKVRKSKRRGTGVDFGADFDHVTSYGTQFEVCESGIGTLF